MLSEIRTVEYVSRHTSIPIPRIYSYDVDPSNPFGAPYMLMEEVQGHAIHVLPRVPEQYMRHVYRQIAKIVLQLSKIQFPLIGLPRGKDKDSGLHIDGAIFEGYKRVDAFKSAREFYLARHRHYYQQKLDIAARPRYGGAGMVVSRNHPAILLSGTRLWPISFTTSRSKYCQPPLRR